MSGYGGKIDTYQFSERFVKFPVLTVLYLFALVPLLTQPQLGFFFSNAEMNECPIEQFFVLVMKTFLGQLQGFTVSKKYCSYACFTANPLEPRFSNFGLTLLTKTLPKSMSAKDLYIAQQNSTLRKVFGNPFSL